MPLLFAREHAELLDLAQTPDSPADGGHVVFSGTVRAFNNSKVVSHLFYESYEAVAIAQFAELEAKAKRLFGITSALGVHRLGITEVGHSAVWIKTSAPHRHEAFLATRFLIDELKKSVAIWKQEHYEDGTSTWDQGLCHCAETYEPNKDSSLGPLKKALKALNKDFEALSRARVLLVGAGGLGCPLAINLVGLGIQNLTIFDGDKVEASNLARQFIFTRKDLGHNKAELIMLFLAERFLWTKVVAHSEFLCAQIAASIVSSFDLVIDGSDCMKTKVMLGEITRKAQVAFICASVYGQEGEVAVINPQAQAGCFSCFRKTQSEPGTCAQSGVLSHACAMVAAYASAQALDLLTKPALSLNHLVIINAQSHHHQKISLLRDLSCSACGIKTSKLLRVRS